MTRKRKQFSVLLHQQFLKDIHAGVVVMSLVLFDIELMKNK